ncbi:adenylyl-sulfate kinase [Agrobacterium tumefaciens]|uniref:adenylyl-sulfate kinase n=1 Tax=Agrobacterium tumefaciens TaxID=358 RepID=UPI0021D369A2|nr:adenylyl-sulfate kinase [Agrobacterium tumefaciens]
MEIQKFVKVKINSTTGTDRQALKKHAPAVIWFTGLSGAGKSTIATKLERMLIDAGMHTYLLDGDDLRTGLNRDLGFNDIDRSENIRRVAEVARLMSDAGLLVLVALISPFATDREAARRIIAESEFVEVFVDTPLSVCKSRDPKGLYRRAIAGELSQFTGITSPYEPPTFPEIRLDTTAMSATDSALTVFEYINLRNLLGQA